MSYSRDQNGRAHLAIVLGSYVQDHVWSTDRFPQPGETRRALAFSTGPGGKGFNQAVACFRQRGDVLYLGAIGNDGLGRTAREYAAREGLDCAWQVLDDVATASAGIIVNAEGANQIMVNLAANERMSTAFIAEHESAFAAARVLLVQLENNLDAVQVALALGNRHGLLCVLNPAPMHAGLDSGLLALCNVITPNETEFSMLLANILGERMAADDIADSTDEILHALCRRLGVPTVVITLGARGCFVSHDSATRRGDARDFYRMQAERVTSVDTTGAGDAFNGALVACLAQSPEPAFQQAVRHANRVAGLSTERVGAALAVPSLADVKARFPEPC